jgi:hypothetical protein
MILTTWLQKTVDGCQFKFEDKLIKKVFRFFDPSIAHLHSKFKKYANKSKTNFLRQKFNMGIKKGRISR